MRRIMCLAIQLTLLFSWNTGWTLCQAREANQTLLTRLNAVNQKLKKADPRTEAPMLVSELWTILDEELCSYLDRNEGLSVQELNNGLKDLLGTNETVDRSHSFTNIEFYGEGITNTLPATYADLYWLGQGASTLRVVHKVDGRWSVVGRIEETSFVTQLLPQYRQELKHQLQLKEQKRSHAPIVGPDLPELQSSLIISHSIEDMGILISPSSIRALPSGGVRFVAVHTAAASHSASTLIEWHWTPTTGLKAVSWVWGDQWTYDARTKRDVGRWQSVNKEKEEKFVSLQDFLPR